MQAQIREELRFIRQLLVQQNELLIGLVDPKMGKEATRLLAHLHKREDKHSDNLEQLS